MDSDTIVSYHIFTFPFTWEHTQIGKKYRSFEDRTNIHTIRLPGNSSWENISEPVDIRSKRELYNEQNFFYRFVHKALYDSGAKGDIIRHYERKEINYTSVTYTIHVKKNDSIYTLPVQSITLDLYSTGVGILKFYLINDTYIKLQDILYINQFGRRIFPPFIDTEKGITGTKDIELAESISIEGLDGHPHRFFEDFTGYETDYHAWTPSRFISSLLEDFTGYACISIVPVIDDRMFVACWWGDDAFSKNIRDNQYNYFSDPDWYKLIFVDTDDASCQNDKMLEKKLDFHTLPRWQKYGTLYGLSRYSMIGVMENSDFTKSVFLTHFRTIYHRIVEFCIVQRASLLKFSDQVAHITELKITDPGRIADEISQLYKQFIRFENQVYFDEVTAQDQGIETYEKLQAILGIKEKIKELDRQINELHEYVIVLENQERNRNLALLTLAATMFIVPSFIAGYFSMHFFTDIEVFDRSSLLWINGLLIGVVILVFIGIKAKKRIWIKYLVISIIVLIVLYLIFIISGIMVL